MTSDIRPDGSTCMVTTYDTPSINSLPGCWIALLLEMALFFNDILYASGRRKRWAALAFCKCWSFFNCTQNHPEGGQRLRHVYEYIYNAKSWFSSVSQNSSSFLVTVVVITVGTEAWLLHNALNSAFYHLVLSSTKHAWLYVKFVYCKRHMRSFVHHQRAARVIRKSALTRTRSNGCSHSLTVSSSNTTPTTPTRKLNTSICAIRFTSMTSLISVNKFLHWFLCAHTPCNARPKVGTCVFLFAAATNTCCITPMKRSKRSSSWMRCTTILFSVSDGVRFLIHCRSNKLNVQKKSRRCNETILLQL